MSLVTKIVEHFIEKEIEKQMERHVGSLLQTLKEELHCRDLTYSFDIQISNIVINSTVKKFGKEKSIELTPSYCKSLNCAENSGDGIPGSVFNKVGHCRNDIAVSGHSELHDLTFEKEIASFNVKITSVTFDYQISGMLSY